MGDTRGFMAEQGANAVEKAFLIIEAFRDEEGPLSLQALAAGTGLNKATIIRLVGSLEKFGYVLKVGPGSYALGPAFMTFARIYQGSFQMSDHVLPILRRLVNQTGESAALFVREGDTRICLYKVESTTAALVSRLHEGDRRSILPGGTGRVLLAFSEIPSEWKEYQDVRESYVAVNVGERDSEISSIASPVFRHGQELAAAISVSGATPRFTPDVIEDHRVSLLEAAAELTRRLGGDTRPFRQRLAALRGEEAPDRPKARRA